MSKVRIHPNDELAWHELREIYPPEMAKTVTNAELDSQFRDHEAGLDGSLNLSEFDFKPGATFGLHAHDLDEIAYVVRGSMVFGNRMIPAGSSVFIAKDTLYGLGAGDDGLQLLVFRADGRAQSWEKDEYLRLRAER